MREMDAARGGGRPTVSGGLRLVWTSGRCVVRRIAAECAYVDERGGVGIRLEPAAAIVRQYGEQFRRASRRKKARSPNPSPLLG
jgi:hypothetical protein